MGENYCAHCHKKMRDFTARPNLTSRKMHLTCWKLVNDINRDKIMAMSVWWNNNINDKPKQK